MVATERPHSYSVEPALDRRGGGSGGSATEEFLDRWRLPGRRGSRVWEERFGEHAYLPLADAGFAAALKQAGKTPGDVDVLVVAGTHGRAVKAFGAGAGSPGSR